MEMGVFLGKPPSSKDFTISERFLNPINITRVSTALANNSKLTFFSSLVGSSCPVTIPIEEEYFRCVNGILNCIGIESALEIPGIISNSILFFIRNSNSFVPLLKINNKLI